MTKHSRPTRKNRASRLLSGSGYMRRILANPPLPGTVAIAHIYHDDWCSFWQTGECNCDCHVVYEYPNLRGAK